MRLASCAAVGGEGAIAVTATAGSAVETKERSRVGGSSREHKHAQVGTGAYQSQNQKRQAQVLVGAGVCAGVNSGIGTGVGAGVGAGEGVGMGATTDVNEQYILYNNTRTPHKLQMPVQYTTRTCAYNDILTNARTHHSGGLHSSNDCSGRVWSSVVRGN